MNPPTPPDAALDLEGDWIRGLALAIAGDPHAADDLAQEARLAAWRRGFGDGVPLRAWIAATLHHLQSKRRRGDARRGERERAAAKTEALPDVAELTQRAAAHQRVTAAVLELDEIHRRVILLRFMDGLPPREIAERLGVPARTIYARLRRGLDLLRERLTVRDERSRRALLSAAVPNASFLLGGGVATVKSWVWAAPAALLLLSGWAAWHFRSGADVPAANALGEAAVATAAGSLPASFPSDVAARTALETAASAPDPESLIRGRVVDAAGRPVAGAEVRIASSTTRYSILGGLWRGVETTARAAASDIRGEYAFVAERGRPLDLVFVASGFAPAREISRYAGERVDVTMRRAATMRGRVTDARSGEPIPGVMVSAWPRAASGRGKKESAATTDAEGRYSIIDLLPGETEVWLQSTTHVLQVGMTLMPADGEDSARDWKMSKGARIWGRVTDAKSGEPIEGAEVSTSVFFTQCVKSDAAGEYLLSPIAAGNTQALHVRKAGYAADDATLEQVAESGETVHFKLSPGRRAHGRVVDSTGRPIAGAAAIAGSEQLLTFIGEFLRATSAADGRFAFDDVRRDLDHSIGVVAPGYAPVLRPFPDSERTSDDVDLGDVVLAPGGSIEGILVSSDGAPIAGTMINVEIGRRLESGAFDDGMNATMISRPVEVRTDARGRFFAADLSGPWITLMPLIRGLALSRRPEISIQIAPGERKQGVVLRVDLGESITGTVVGPDGAPCSGVSIHSMQSDDGRQTDAYAVSQTDGTFQMQGLAPGKHTLKIEADFRWFSTVDAESRVPLAAVTYAEGVEAGAKNIRLSIPPPNSIEGSVVDERGAPMEGCSILVHDARYGFSLRTTDRDGHFSLPVADGISLSIEFAARGREQYQTIDGVRSGTKDLRVVFAPQRPEGVRR